MAPRSWCEVCRGGADGGEELVARGDCPRRFHVECAGLRRAADAGAGWTCGLCGASDGADAAGRKKRVAFVREHKELNGARASSATKAKLAPFVEAKRLGALCGPKGAKDGPLEPFVIGNRESCVQAALRDYQVVGVNWFLERHALGVGGILGDEMGLGKTVQTLAFLGALKASGKPGRTSSWRRRVLQNWVNEIKKFTPSLTVAKVHGSIAERERVLGDVDVASGGVYLATTLCGIQIFNFNNNLGELWALLQFVLPTALGDSKLDDERKLPKHRRPGGFEGADDDAHLDLDRSGALLNACMLRRVKADVESTLLPKIDGVAKARDRELRGLAGAGLVRSSGKLALLDRLLARKKAAGSRVLLFSQFTLTLDVLEEYCAAHHGDRGVGYLRHQSGDGDTVVLYDTCWNPQVDLQAMDRAHRIGQRGQVTVYRLIARDTVEEKVHARAHQKLLLDALVMNGAPRELSDEGEAADLEKLDVTELWSILSAGAAAMFDPTAEQGEDPTDELLDKLIDDARPNDVRAVRVAEEPSAERPAADLAGTIFERDGAVASSSDDEGSDGGLRSAADLEADLKARGLPLTGLKLAIAGAGRRRALQELLELDARTTVFPEDGLNPARRTSRLRRPRRSRGGVDAGAWICWASCPRSTPRRRRRRQAAPRAQGDEDLRAAPGARDSTSLQPREAGREFEELALLHVRTCDAAAKAAKAEKLKKAAEKRERERERERALYPMGRSNRCARAAAAPGASAARALRGAAVLGRRPAAGASPTTATATRPTGPGLLGPRPPPAAAAGGHFYSIDGGLPRPRPPYYGGFGPPPYGRRAPTARAATSPSTAACPSAGGVAAAQARRARAAAARAAAAPAAAAPGRRAAKKRGRPRRRRARRRGGGAAPGGARPAPLPRAAADERTSVATFHGKTLGLVLANRDGARARPEDQGRRQARASASTSATSSRHRRRARAKGAAIADVAKKIQTADRPLQLTLLKRR
ncbi:helicase [Aureococcus anophagefferens]|nr:helicase [Aureococcus anophagefferens]